MSGKIRQLFTVSCKLCNSSRKSVEYDTRVSKGARLQFCIDLKSDGWEEIDRNWYCQFCLGEMRSLK